MKVRPNSWQEHVFISKDKRSQFRLVFVDT